MTKLFNFLLKILTYTSLNHKGDILERELSIIIETKFF